MMENIFSKSIVSILFNLSICLIIILLILGIIEFLTEKYKIKKIVGGINNPYEKTLFKKKGFLKKFYNNLNGILVEKNKEGATSFIYYLIIFIVISSVIGLVLVKQLLLAIIVPVVIIKVVDAAVTQLRFNIVEEIELGLPFAIDNIIRVYSKYADIRTILYESSKGCNKTLKEILNLMAREMSSAPPGTILMKYGKKYDNVWFYSLMFTLSSYLESSNKEDTLNNLRNLRDILEKENLTNKSKVTDKRYGVVVNLVISICAIIGLVLQILFNPFAKAFFFSTFIGINCFIIGWIFIIITLFISIKMIKNKK